MTKSFFLATTAMVLGAGLAQASTLEDVRERGAVICGVTQGVHGFSNPDDAGNWTGFDVDILSRTTSRTLNRDTALELNFAPVMFYDGQVFMVRERLSVTSARDLDGATVGASAGSTTELNLADYFSANDMRYSPVRFNRAEDGMTMVCVTHEMAFARKVANRVIVMDQGQIVEEVNFEEFFNAPKTDRARLFLSQVLQH